MLAYAEFLYHITCIRFFVEPVPNDDINFLGRC